MRAVLDTNIVLDLLYFADARTRALRRAIDDGSLCCFTDRHCLSELERVSGYPRFALDGVARQALLAGYCNFVTLCPAGDGEDCRLPRCRDADDQKFLALAQRCRADLLITRDRQLLALASRRRVSLPCAIVTAEAAAVRITSR
ncbi:MAG TPA: putative toxin-antitoxin system toxin component, PIN family [Accumulibacter sp.]|mgnify:CR=1 FL=1|uniref:putative toxin-antitoxin system toxin component, PIN family n=1 Tax=Accumulibacter sp. TaxID=2053492 RepID=UPI0025F33656|nr:putative toxin-antitoxin system toxin component, PIN family [Accumulibacter sp.]MCM8663029.1 putative toxin-antitoxin system toxin component, PIN family [Accumulibacter sp.]HNC52696.1 putative toxin-antitoxin system toxin component, PIN family [Accumulibacter sp.]